MKFCRDCKHMRRSWGDRLLGFDALSARCQGTPRVVEHDPVTGKPLTCDKWPCCVARAEISLCGPDARYFEPRRAGG